MSKPVILTGLRANAAFHLGSYLGAILPMVQLQEEKAGEYQLNMFIPDLHSITTPIDYAKLGPQIIENLKVYVAAGFDCDNPDTYIYRQSRVSAHSELMWILSCFTGVGELGRMTQFKEKKADLSTLAGGDADAAKPYISAGLYNYPVLMAADILLYGAEWIPLGADQQQHLELARDLAIRMNNKFGDLFTVPQEWKKQLEFSHRDNSVRVRSLRIPDKKMSKSVSDPAGTILLTDQPDEAAKKVMSAETDSLGAIHLDWENQPGVSNLLQISALLAGAPLATTAAAWDGKSSYGELKSQVAGQVKEFLTSLQSKLADVDVSMLESTLEKHEASMRQVADTTLRRVQQAVGLRSHEQ